MPHLSFKGDEWLTCLWQQDWWPSCYLWIHLIEFFSMIPVMSWLELRCVFIVLFFISFFSIPSPHYNLWRERIEKKKEKKIWWHTEALIAIYYWYHKKNLDEINLTTPKKSPTMNRVGHFYCQKQANHLLTLNSKCGTLRLLLIIFFWYRWIHFVDIFSMILKM